MRLVCTSKPPEWCMNLEEKAEGGGGKDEPDGLWTGLRKEGPQCADDAPVLNSSCDVGEPAVPGDAGESPLTPALSPAYRGEGAGDCQRVGSGQNEYQFLGGNVASSQVAR